MPTTKSKEEWARYHRERWANLSPEAKARRNQKAKEWRNSKSGKEKLAAYREENKYRLKAVGINMNVKASYPDTWSKTTLSIDVLEEWLSKQVEAVCPYCGNPATSADHIIPLARGGLHELNNLEMICLRCNHAKRDLSKEEFQAWIETVYEYTRPLRNFPERCPSKETQ